MNPAGECQTTSLAQAVLDGRLALEDPSEHRVAILSAALLQAVMNTYGEDHDGKTGADGQKRQHGWAAFRLPRFGRCFNDLTLLFLCHDALAQIFGASAALSKTGVFSTSPGPVPEAVSSAAWRSASVIASRPSTVSLA